MTDAWCVYDVVEPVDGQVVYVGCSKNPKLRRKAHRSSGVCSYHATIEVVGSYPDKKSAMAAEAARIRKLNPPKNRKYVGRERSINHPDTMSKAEARKVWLRADKTQTDATVLIGMPGWNYHMALHHFGPRRKLT